MKTIVIALMLFLTGCASTEMRALVGKPVEEAFIEYGRAENVFQMPDGRRAYQFRWGGGVLSSPGNTVSTGSTTGNVTTVITTATPVMIYQSQGCLITFIARDSGGERFVIEEYRVPRQLVC